MTTINNSKIETLHKGGLLSISDINQKYKSLKYVDRDLEKELRLLNNLFQKKNIARETDRSLFFTAIIIALRNDNFRNIYTNIQPPKQNTYTSEKVLLEAKNLNNEIIKAIDTELEGKLNNYSKEMIWTDTFSFIKEIDIPLFEYKDIIKRIYETVYILFENGVKQDILGHAYKTFLSRAGAAEDKNIILTPDHIRHLMIKLARLTEKSVVLDTCTGTGGFLMDSMEVMLNLPNSDADNITKHQLIGFETDRILFSLACSNMFLHGDGLSNIIYRSSLIDDPSESIINTEDRDIYEYIRKFQPDRVIINPPYEDNKPIHFCLSALKYLNNDGKLIVIMPSNTLIINQRNENESLTKQLLAMGRLDFVIRMPERLFAEQKRDVNTSIFGFTKTQHQPDDYVLFSSLNDDGFHKVQHKARCSKENNWDEIEEYIYESIYGNSITPTNKYYGNISKKKIFSKSGQLDCNGVQTNTVAENDMIPIGDIFHVEKGTLQSSKNIEGEYPFVTCSNKPDWKTHNEYHKDGEYLIYAFNSSGSLGKCQYINDKFVASDLNWLLSDKKNPKYKINIKFYNYYLNSIRDEILNSNVVKHNQKKSLDETKFKQYPIRYVPYKTQIEFVHTYIEPLEKMEEDMVFLKANLNKSLLNII